jgi:hypothetical protein
MSYATFCQLTVKEFDKILGRWAEKSNREFEDRWEQTRIKSYFSIARYLKENTSIQAFMKFAWDGKKKGNQPQGKIRDPERFERLKKEYGETL